MGRYVALAMWLAACGSADGPSITPFYEEPLASYALTPDYVVLLSGGALYELSYDGDRGAMIAPGPLVRFWVDHGWVAWTTQMADEQGYRIELARRTPQGETQTLSWPEPNVDVENMVPTPNGIALTMLGGTSWIWGTTGLERAAFLDGLRISAFTGGWLYAIGDSTITRIHLDGSGQQTFRSTGTFKGAGVRNDTAVFAVGNGTSDTVHVVDMNTVRDEVLPSVPRASYGVFALTDEDIFYGEFRFHETWTRALPRPDKEFVNALGIVRDSLVWSTLPFNTQNLRLYRAPLDALSVEPDGDDTRPPYL